ncbi:MAG TPA: 30S ribosomal protein S9 [Candidatus Deferrimicrobium sp.]|nr:30S ribosomal protein S9 [Candidatus Deferrimicrobium sp.]
MEKEVFAATGRRKTAVARAVITAGDGKFTINGRSVDEYLLRDTLVELAQKPLLVTETMGSLNIRCTTRGGGSTGQAGAVRLALSRALVLMNPDFRPTLRDGGYLTRDAREVERKKYGHPKARKRYQYSKR